MVDDVRPARPWRLGLVQLVALLVLAAVPLLSQVAFVGVPAAISTGPDNGAEVFNVKAYGAVGDGVTDDGAAIAAADTAAAGGQVFFPAGVYAFSSPLTANSAWRGSGIGGTTLKLTTSLTAGTAAINVYPATPAAGLRRRGVSLRDLTVRGPGAPSLGTKTASADGVSLNASTRLEHVRVERFDSGVVLSAPEGHTTLSDVTSTGNYYGVYVAEGGRAHYVVDSSLSGNTFAAVASPATVPVTELRVEKTAVGAGPYGFYQEGTGTAGSWLKDIVLSDVSFAEIGNGAFFTENSSTTGGGIVEALRIDGPAFSWSATHRIGARAKDYAVVVGRALGRIEIIEPSQPITAGTLGTLYVNEQSASWDWIRKAGSAPVIAIGTGTMATFDIKSTRVEQRRGRGSIPAGLTSTTITLDYMAPADAILPIVRPLTTGGLATAPTLVVGSVVAVPGTGTSFTVSVVGGVPTSGLEFLWRI